jgi:putative DNA methylase
MTNKKNNSPKLWYSRGYLPHFDGGEVVQFITFRLADSLPKKVLGKWQKELELDLISEIEYHRKIDKYLDKSYGECYLKDSRIAEMIEETLFFFDGKKYKLIAYVLMPNHIHILIKPLKNHSLASIMHSIKSYTSHEANKILGRKGKFWSKEYFDRFMRNYEHFTKTVDYIHNNPVKAGLCKKYDEWCFSSGYIEKS